MKSAQAVNYTSSQSTKYDIQCKYLNHTYDIHIAADNKRWAFPTTDDGPPLVVNASISSSLAATVVAYLLIGTVPVSAVDYIPAAQDVATRRRCITYQLSLGQRKCLLAPLRWEYSHQCPASSSSVTCCPKKKKAVTRAGEATPATVVMLAKHS